MAEIIEFRPHHFICTLGFQGHGYSLSFVKNYKKIARQLASNEDTLIKVTSHIDSICIACPNKVSETLCKTQNKISILDSRHQEVLHLKTEEILSWKEAKLKIKKYMDIEKFEYACNGCSWKDYGVCKKSLEDLLRG